MWRVTHNDDRGSLFTGGVRLSEGDAVRIAGEDRPRRVTYVMGSQGKGWRACFRGQGAVPTGKVRWVVRESVARWPAAGGPVAAASTWTSPLVTGPLRSERPVLVTGFDSAWTRGRRGAIASCLIDREGVRAFHPPVTVGFGAAQDFVTEREREWRHAVHLVVLDQPLVVPNLEGARPVERALGRVISRYGGGVQPANRSRPGMFDRDAPLWPFLDALGADLDPAHLPGAGGRVIVEGYPALSLLGLFPAVRARGSVVRYNPERTATFRREDWAALGRALAGVFERAGLPDAAAFCERAADGRPRKADQDAVDALVCLLVGLLLVTAPSRMVQVGDAVHGYVVAPADAEFERELREAAERAGVAVTTLGGAPRGSPAAVRAALARRPSPDEADVAALLDAIAAGRRPARPGPDLT